MVRENRLYQADWLMRFYGFDAHEILDDQPFLDLDVDPKLAWAIRHRECFPVVLQVAPYEMILRVPGISVKLAMKIVRARRRGQITLATIPVNLSDWHNRAENYAEGEQFYQQLWQNYFQATCITERKNMKRHKQA